MWEITKEDEKIVEECLKGIPQDLKPKQILRIRLEFNRRLNLLMDKELVPER